MLPMRRQNSLKIVLTCLFALGLIFSADALARSSSRSRPQGRSARTQQRSTKRITHPRRSTPATGRRYERTSPSLFQRFEALGKSRSVSRNWNLSTSKTSSKPRSTRRIQSPQRRSRTRQFDVSRSSRRFRHPPIRTRGTRIEKHRTPDRSVRYDHRHKRIYSHRPRRIYRRVVWPSYSLTLRYRHGSHFAVRYVYPYYHRKHIFVSLGGYWPVHYRYVRYYWYGWHPYHWYGHYIPTDVDGDTYNIYNYYGDTQIVGSGEIRDSEGRLLSVDEDTFADVREKLKDEKAVEPEAETDIDKFFDEGVKAFEANDYDLAVLKLQRARNGAKDDIVMPFALSQALFADGRYTQAAKVLRQALAKVEPEKQGIFYPRGLYADDEILLAQIDRLQRVARLHPSDADIQLLLGYHLLGTDRLDEAVEPLKKAAEDDVNRKSAEVLIGLQQKMATEQAEQSD